MKYLATIRFGAMSHVGAFRADFSGLRMGDRCVIRSERGIEFGDILNPVQPYAAEDAQSGVVGEVVRKLNAEDLKKLQTLRDVDQPKEFEFCKKKIQERNLPMKLASVEHLLGGSKIIFYFLADGRVDFRELVKDLAQEYHTRIEMRQIGVRDEARLLADYEHCGRELCCKTFIKNLEPVTMKMAKNQKATLDPTKISGRCGRLMCCLRFEDAVYEDIKSGLPGMGVLVETPEGQGEVVAQDSEKKLVTVALAADKRQVTVPLAQIKTLCPKEAAAKAAAEEPEERLPDE